MPGFCSVDQNETALWHSVAVLCCDVRHKIKTPYVVPPWYLIKLRGLCVVVVVQLLSCVWLCNPPDCSTPGSPVSHYLLKLAQTHVHWVSDAIQPSHPLPSLGSFTMSQLFSSSSQSIGASASASVLPTNIQDWFPLGWTGWITLQSKGLSSVFSSTTVFKSISFSVFNQFPFHSVPVDNIFSPNTPPYHGAQAQSLLVPE